VITIHQRYRRTDRRTDRRHAIAIPRFALKCIARYKYVSSYVLKIMLHENHPKFTCSPFTLQK